MGVEQYRKTCWLLFLLVKKLLSWMFLLFLLGYGNGIIVVANINLVSWSITIKIMVSAPYLFLISYYQIICRPRVCLILGVAYVQREILIIFIYVILSFKFSCTVKTDYNYYCRKKLFFSSVGVKALKLQAKTNSLATRHSFSIQFNFFFSNTNDNKHKSLK